MPVRERVLGAGHPNTLAARASLAFWTGEAGEAAARDQSAALLPVLEQVARTGHSRTLAAPANITDSRTQVAARDQGTALLAVRERVMGGEHLDTRPSAPTSPTGQSEQAIVEGSDGRARLQQGRLT
jgi:hypothetical protein